MASFKALCPLYFERNCKRFKVKMSCKKSTSLQKQEHLKEEEKRETSFTSSISRILKFFSTASGTNLQVNLVRTVYSSIPQLHNSKVVRNKTTLLCTTVWKWLDAYLYGKNNYSTYSMITLSKITLCRLLLCMFLLLFLLLNISKFGKCDELQICKHQWRNQLTSIGSGFAYFVETFLPI